ncbi:hypothetical protein K438DRAFT_1770621 [Mycena galopus ATCC 62051]|nr:hypothetical protein K438DRAFT_1770621 [Mycena galopus ATCC 62051]
MSWFGFNSCGGCRCNAMWRCTSCYSRMAYLPAPSPSTAYVNPNSPYPVYTTGPALASWTSPRTTTVQYANGRLHFEDTSGFRTHGPYYGPQQPAWPVGWPGRWW